MTRRLLAIACLLLGLAALVEAGRHAAAHSLRTRPSGGTAGGAATAADLCRRGLPPDVEVACLAEQERVDGAERMTIGAFGGLALVGLLGAAWLYRRAASTPATRSAS